MQLGMSGKKKKSYNAPYRSDEYNYKNNHNRIENHVKMRIRSKKKMSGFYACTADRIKVLPVMASVTMRKKVVNTKFLSSVTAIFSFVRISLKQLYVLIALKLR